MTETSDNFGKMSSPGDEIKAIPTSYNGYLFRSRLEARWAVVFDCLGVRYEYEREGFDLGDGMYYLPDFFLPALEMWVEIKGQRPTQSELAKAKLLAQQSKQNVVILYGDVDYGCFSIVAYPENMLTLGLDLSSSKEHRFIVWIYLFGFRKKKYAYSAGEIDELVRRSKIAETEILRAFFEAQRKRFWG